jgi:hypothetical protein
MTKTARPRRIRIHPYVEAALAKRLSEYSSAIGATSAVVQAAVREYLDQTSDAPLVLRRLDRLGRAVAHIQRDLELLSGAFGFWLKLWFARKPSAPEGAMASAESRYRQFVDYLGKQFSGGHRLSMICPARCLATRLSSAISPLSPGQSPSQRSRRPAASTAWAVDERAREHMVFSLVGSNC